MIDEEKSALFSAPAAEVSTISPWPETPPDVGILILSDTDDGYEDGDSDMDSDMD